MKISAKSNYGNELKYPKSLWSQISHSGQKLYPSSLNIKESNEQFEFSFIDNLGILWRDQGLRSKIMRLFHLLAFINARLLSRNSKIIMHSCSVENLKEQTRLLLSSQQEGHHHFVDINLEPILWHTPLILENAMHIEKQRKENQNQYHICDVNLPL